VPRDAIAILTVIGGIVAVMGAAPLGLAIAEFKRTE